MRNHSLRPVQGFSGSTGHFIFGALLAASVGVGAASAQFPDPQLFDSPWIGYDTGVYPEGLWPMSSRSADFNGDGNPDLATVSFGGTPYLSILLGDGNGGYFPPTLHRLELDLESLDLEVGDFDKDGDVDIVTCDTDRFWGGISVSLYKNDGEGGFTFFNWYDMGDHGPSSITAADFDGDGWLDVATANDAYIVSNNTVSVLMNNGSGGFMSADVYTINGGTRAIDSGDLNGDGHPDIVVGHEGNRWTVMMNDQEGGFSQTAFIPGLDSGSIPEFPQVHVFDADLDGDLDVIFSNRDTGGFGEGSIGLWRNNGDGTFATPEEISFNWYTAGAVEVSTGDVTEDGWPDIVAVTSWGLWFLVPGDGAGGFLDAVRFRAGDSTISSEITDLNLDGRADITILAGSSLEACVYLNPGGGAFVQPPVIDMVDPSMSPAFTTNIQASDLDHDGDLDFAVGFRSDFNEFHGVSVRYNNGDGSFAPAVIYQEVTYPLWIAFDDMNGDGWDDLLWVDSNGRFRIRINDGAGDLGNRVSYHTFSGAVDVVDGIDIDNDGDLDVVADGGFSIGISKNLGGNNYAAPVYHDLGSPVGTFGLGDFNEDGNLDLLTDTAPQGYVQISFGNGDGTFGSPHTVATGRDVQAIATGDLDNDGHLDLATYYNLDEMGLGVRRGRGDGNFFLGDNFHGSRWAGDHTSTLKLVDVDADGLLDAMTANFGAQDVSFWKGLGDGTFERLDRYGVGEQAFDMVYGDFTGDGIGDVLTSVRADNGRWWYTGAVLIRGLDPGGTAGTPADLTDVNVPFGTLLSGGLAEIEASDDVYLETRSQFGFSALEPNIVEVIVGATTTTASQTTLDLSIEGFLNNPGGSAKVRLRNWGASQFQEVGTFPMNQTETVNTIEGVDASGYVRGSDGRIELSTRVSVIATFSAAGFDASFDWFEILVNQ